VKCSNHNCVSFPAVLAMTLFTVTICACAQIAPGVVTLAASNVVAVGTNAGATINGNVNPNGADTTAWFEWGNTTAYGNSTQPQNIGTGSSAVTINAALTNLISGVTYHYRCAASNSFGVGRGADQFFWSPALTLNGLSRVTNECHAPFVAPGAFVSGRPRAIAAGSFYSVALKADGTVVSWGDNSYGQTIIPTSATNAVAIAAGGGHSLALKAEGEIVSWGNNSSGQINIPASATNVVAIAAGGSHSLALKADGEVIGWGWNAYGQTNTPASATNVVAIASGGSCSLALKSDGIIVGWGNNNYGQTNTPASATNVVAIAVGGGHSLALKANGKVVGWGNNSSGQATIPASATNVVAIAAGDRHSLALKANGTIVGWGYNFSGQVTVPAAAINVVAIAAGYDFSLALKADGSVIGWGYNPYGQTTIPAGLNQLNLPITFSGTVDVNAPGTYLLNYSTTNALGASATTTRTVIVTDTVPPVLTLLGNNPLMLTLGVPFVDPGATAVDLCANNLIGSIVTNLTTNPNIPAIYTNTYTVTDPSGNTTQTNRTVVVGGPLATTLPASNRLNTTAMLNGTVNPMGVATTAWFEWGSSRAYGNITAGISVGGGTNAVAASIGLTDLTQGLTYHFRCVASNSVWVSRGVAHSFWVPTLMLNSSNPMTNECHLPFVDPTTVKAFPTTIAAGWHHSLALKTDGTVIGWGDNTSGQTNTPASATNAIAISAGYYHNLALKPDGTVVGWGHNTYGQTIIPASATNVVAIAAGTFHSLALKADGRVVGWGDNTYGETDIPTSATNVVAFAAAGYHSLALKANSTVIGWGNNSSGQINIPASATNVVAIAAGASHSLALKANGTIVGWGQNTFGQVTIPSSATNVVAIAAGYEFSLALRADGTVVVWGYNLFGQTNSPISATNVMAIAAGGNHSVALKTDGTVIAWGYNIYGQTNIPVSVYQLNLPIAVNGSVDVNVPGTYLLNYSVTNSMGAVATASRTVVVADTLPPVLTLLGSNPLMHELGNPFLDPGVIATDLCAGDLIASVVTNLTVNPNDPFTYTNTYAVTDPSGHTTQTNRTVVVVTRPALTGLSHTDNGTFQFTFTNTPGARFSVLASTNVAQPLSQWTVLGPATENAPGRFQFMDVTATNRPVRYYRLRWP
jgi:trimeric autotransporter adhesin